MKKKIRILTIAVLIFSFFMTLKLENLLNKTSILNKEPVTNNIDAISNNKTYKSKKILDVDTTWGECLNSNIKETNTEHDSPRQDISDDHKVIIVKIEYANGIECKGDFYNYGLITQIFDKKTGELLTSVGYYTDNK